MKKLSIEEKAKRYDEILAKAKRYYDEYKTRDNILYVEDMEDMFPELKESEDERIRKELIDFIYDKTDTYELREKSNSWLAWLEKQGEQKLYVNDNAKEMFIKALECVEEQNNKGYKLTDCDKNSWWEDFKAYTYCIVEQKPWSEEDEYCRHQLIAFCENCMAQDACSKRCAHWLKSLKPQTTWKPSDEQMNALNYVINLMASSERPTENDLYYNILKSLRQQLKKLKE